MNESTTKQTGHAQTSEEVVSDALLGEDDSIYGFSERVQVPKALLKDLAEIAFDYANPDGAKYHGLPMTAKGIARVAGNEAAKILDQSN